MGDDAKKAGKAFMDAGKTASQVRAETILRGFSGGLFDSPFSGVTQSAPAPAPTPAKITVTIAPDVPNMRAVGPSRAVELARDGWDLIATVNSNGKPIAFLMQWTRSETPDGD